jgi:hypothetical protein
MIVKHAGSEVALTRETDRKETQHGDQPDDRQESQWMGCRQWLELLDPPER